MDKINLLVAVFNNNNMFCNSTKRKFFNFRINHQRDKKDDTYNDIKGKVFLRNIV